MSEEKYYTDLSIEEDENLLQELEDFLTGLPSDDFNKASELLSEIREWLEDRDRRLEEYSEELLTKQVLDAASS